MKFWGKTEPAQCDPSDAAIMNTAVRRYPLLPLPRCFGQAPQRWNKYRCMLGQLRDFQNNRRFQEGPPSYRLLHSLALAEHALVADQIVALAPL